MILKAQVNRLGQLGILKCIGLAVNFVSGIVVARKLGPDNLGVAALVMAIVVQANMVISFNAPGANVRFLKNFPTGDEERRFIESVYVSRWFLCTLLTFLSLLLYFVFSDKVPFLLIIFGCLLLFVQVSDLGWVFVGKEEQQKYYLGQLIFGFVYLFGIVVFTQFYRSAITELSVRLAAMLLMSLFLWLQAGKVFQGFIRVGRSVRLAFNYFKESYVIYVSTLIQYLYAGIDIILLSFFVPDRDLGLYKTGLQVAVAVQAFFSVLPQWYYPMLLNSKNAGGIEDVWGVQRHILKYLIGFGLVGSAFVVGFGDKIYSMMFGPEYVEGSMAFMLLLVSRFVWVSGDVFVWGLITANKDKAVILILFSVTIVSIISNFLLIPRFGINATAGLKIVTEAILLILGFYWVRIKR